VLGIDDGAFKKGHTYGTILVDLEARCPVDLLPDRSADSVATWLQAHPGAEIVCRDRARVYADGVTRGAPDAIQVADRFHLLKNLSTALQEVFAREQDAIQAALFPAPADPDPLPADPDPPSAALDLPPSVSPARRLTRPVARKQENRARRVAQYESVQDLHAQGYTQRAIAAETGLHRATVAKFIAADTFPERQERPPQPGILDPYKPYLHQRLAAGCQTGMHLFRELQAQGYTGSQARVLGYLAQYRREQGLPPRKHMGEQPVPSCQVRIRHVVGLVLRRADRLHADEQQERARLWQASPTVTQASEVALAFTELVRQRAGDQLDGWLVQATQSGIAPLVQFATGIRETYAEVRAALVLPWSSGQVEGQINRLKTIKRQMYGRAKFALLRARVLAPG
jgi:transposase